MLDSMIILCSTSSSTFTVAPGILRSSAYTGLRKVAFSFFGDRVQYDVAKAACQADGPGYDLAVINSIEEQQLLWNLSGRILHQPIWIGLRRDNDSRNFTWVDGSRPAFTYWADTEPNDFNRKEDCVRMGHPFEEYGDNGTWFDTQCRGRSSYACSGPSKNEI